MDEAITVRRNPVASAGGVGRIDRNKSENEMTPDEAIALVQKYGKDAQVRVDGYSTWQDSACVLAGEVERLTSANIIAEGLAKQNKEMAENFIALKQERDQLLISLGKPEEITSPPHEDYECLKKQYLALRSLANSKCRMASHWSSQCEKMTRDLLLTKGGIIDAERNTNAILTDQLLQAEQERDELRHSVKFISTVNESYNDVIDTLTKERDELRRRVAELTNPKLTNCWKCSDTYEIKLGECPHCGAANANVNWELAKDQIQIEGGQ